MDIKFLACSNLQLNLTKLLTLTYDHLLVLMHTKFHYLSIILSEEKTESQMVKLLTDADANANQYSDYEVGEIAEGLLALQRRTNKGKNRDVTADLRHLVDFNFLVSLER